MLTLRALRADDADAAMQAQAELALDGFTFLIDLDEALVTCDHDNVGSIRVIERCGGRHVDTVTNAEGTPTRHYRVPTR